MPSVITISIAVLALVLLLLLISRGIVVVGTDSVGVVKRLGRFHSIQSPGVGFVLPLVDRVRMVDMRVVQSSIRCASATRDGVAVVVDATLQRRVVDPRLAVFAVSDYCVAVNVLVESSLAALVRTTRFDDWQRQRVSDRLMLHFGDPNLEGTADRWGVRIERVDVSDLVRDSQRQAEVDRAGPPSYLTEVHYLGAGYTTLATFEAAEPAWQDEYPDMASAERAARRWLASQGGEARVEILVDRLDGESTSTTVTQTGIE